MPNQKLREKERTQKVIHNIAPKVGAKSNDVGGTEVQVALMTDRIQALTEHLKTHKKDFSTQRGLLKLVGQRRRMLEYLKSSNPKGYTQLITALELRK